MQLWISRDVPTPISAQLSAQFLLGILSGSLAPGHKLPSVRELARRLKIHANTVSAVYHDLASRGWVESKRGSGVFVKNQKSIDAFAREWVAAAQTQGHSIADLRQALDRLASPVARLMVVDPDPELARILAAELSEALDTPVPHSAIPATPPPKTMLWINAGQAAQLAQALPGVASRTLNLRSMPEILAGSSRPAAPTLIGVVSYSSAVRNWAKTLLAAVGFPPDALLLRDPAQPNWKRGLKTCGVIGADLVAAREVEASVFRLLTAESIAAVRVTLQKLP
jgi:DNA-binding transcriptional regulator YhcF (GntR family)